MRDNVSDKFKLKWRDKKTGEEVMEYLPATVKARLRRKSGFNGSNIRTIEDARKYGKGIIDYWNRTLRDFESPREFIDIVEI